MAGVLTVLTFKGADHLIEDGGSQSWVISRPRVLACEYIVCARHQQGPYKAEGSEPHKSAFLVGRISGVVASEETPGRWRVEFDEYALIDGPKLPLYSASPTQYFNSLAELGIDEAALTWRSTSESQAGPPPSDATPSHAEMTVSAPSSKQMPASVLASAKAMVAAQLGVKPEAVEISVRF